MLIGDAEEHDSGEECEKIDALADRSGDTSDIESSELFFASKAFNASPNISMTPSRGSLIQLFCRFNSVAYRFITLLYTLKESD